MTTDCKDYVLWLTGVTLTIIGTQMSSPPAKRHCPSHLWQSELLSAEY